MALCQGYQIQRDDLPEQLRNSKASSPQAGRVPSHHEQEKAETIALLKKHNGQVKAAAADSGIHMVTLYRRLKNYGLKASDFRS